MRLPKFGQTMEEAEILEFLIDEGSAFDVGADVYNVETEKSTVTVTATVAGRLGRIVVNVGDVVAPGTVVAVVLDEHEDRSADEMLAFAAGAEIEVADEPSTEAPANQETTRTSDLDIPQNADEPIVAERTELHSIRLQSARVVSESWQSIPHFQQVVLADATNILKARQELRDSGSQGESRATLNDLLLDRIIEAVLEVPVVNATFRDNVITRFADVNIAVAVTTERGLVVPVLRRSNAMTLEERVVALRTLTSKATEGSLQPSDSANATITVSNLGMHGVDTGFALVTRPQAAIIFVGSIEKRPMVVDDIVVARPSVYLSVSYDHRVVDGSGAAQFLTALRRHVEA